MVSFRGAGDFATIHSSADRVAKWPRPGAVVVGRSDLTANAAGSLPEPEKTGRLPPRSLLLILKTIKLGDSSGNRPSLQVFVGGSNFVEN